MARCHGAVAWRGGVAQWHGAVAWRVTQRTPSRGRTTFLRSVETPGSTQGSACQASGVQTATSAQHCALRLFSQMASTQGSGPLADRSDGLGWGPWVGNSGVARGDAPKQYAPTCMRAPEGRSTQMLRRGGRGRRLNGRLRPASRDTSQCIAMHRNAPQCAAIHRNASPASLGTEASGFAATAAAYAGATAAAAGCAAVSALTAAAAVRIKTGLVSRAGCCETEGCEPLVQSSGQVTLKQR